MGLFYPSRDTQRPRWALALGVVLVIAAGLASRRFPQALPAVLDKYPGDALWAWMVFLLLAGARPGATHAWLAGVALLISYGVEFSQLIHFPWLDAFRSTTLGHLMLGTTFAWGDMLAYTVGVALAVGVDVLWRRGRRRGGWTA